MTTSTGAGLIEFREFLIDIIDDDVVMMIIDDPSSDPIIRVFILAPNYVSIFLTFRHASGRGTRLHL